MKKILFALLLFSCTHQEKENPHQLSDSVRHRKPIAVERKSELAKATKFKAVTLDPKTAGTANDPAMYISYNEQYGFGENPGWYGMNWSTQKIIELGKNIGSHTFRMQLYDNFKAMWGWGSLLPDYDYLNSIGAIGTTAMIGGVSAANADNPFNVPPAATWDNPAGRVFKGMYEPIWLDAAKTQINPANTYAVFVADVIKNFGSKVKFWEIRNEPDFSYHINGTGDAETEWMNRDPDPGELWNLRATVQYYIRELRISWEVIKKLSPKSYVCTGGIGTNSFLDAILRMTDNPDGGKVTAEYPLHGGAYFDVLSFHTYPEFSPDVKHWTNDDGGHQVYNRQSDAFIAGHMRKKNDLQNVLLKFGYGSTYPQKHFICTETGASRVMDNDNGGSNELQKNYMIKSHVAMIRDGQIRQTYWYQTADAATNGSHWDMFGCYYYFGDKFPPNAIATDQGIAMRTTSTLLYGKVYDSVKTKSLNLPSTVDGAAFKGDSGFIYCLWAKTVTDLSEVATASITLPEASYNTTTWNGTKGTTGKTITLTGTPIFLQPVGVTPGPVDPGPTPTPTETYTGKKGYWILESKRIYYKVYKLSNGSFQIKTGDYNWYKI